MTALIPATCTDAASALGLALPFGFERPVWLWLLLLVPVLVLASFRTLSGLDPLRRALALATRSALVVALAACLARVQHVQRNDDLTVLFLMDRSHSVEPLQSLQEEYIRQVTRQVPPEDRTGVIEFAREAFTDQSPTTGGYLRPPGSLSLMPNADRTNVAAAMRLAVAMFPHDTAKRIVLLSDGNDNMGDVLAEAGRAAADGIPVDVVPLQYRHQNEIYFDRMIAPTHAEPGEQLPVRMVVNTIRKTSARIVIAQDGAIVPLSAEQSRVDLEPGDNTLFVKLGFDSPGAHTITATIQPDDDSMDATARNNTAGAFTFVSGAGTALLITHNPRDDEPFLAALRSEKVRVEMKTPAQLGDFGLLQMMNYAAIILANVPAASFTDDQQRGLAVYVKDMGSGLIMLGGDEGFGAGGWIGSPVEEVMPVTFEIKHKRVIPRGALVVIMHSCEINRGQYWGKEMAKKSVDTISSRDYIGVLAYSWSPGGENWQVPLDLNTNKAAVKAKIHQMRIGDMPDFDTTMRMAYKALTAGRGRDAAQKHVIILSDGDASPPSRRLLSNYKNAKITVSTIAIGWGAHVNVGAMQRISRATGGKFYQARNPRALPQIFVKESKVVRRPLIVDEPFQPQLFHAHSELLGGASGLAGGIPPLGGMILTSPKQSPNVLVPLIRATDDGEDPVLAHWQYQLGKTVAFTSGQWPVWGQQWMQWPKFAKFWAQIVRWTMRQDAPANFDTYTKVEGNRARIVIDALDKDAGYLNRLQLRTNVVGPDGSSVPVEFAQTGPGHYEAEVPVEKSGQYLASVRAFDADGNTIGTIRTGVSVPFSPEYRDLMPNEALLRQVAQMTGGRWLDMPPEQADIFSHDLPPTEARRAAWPWVLSWLLLPLFLLDVAVRRLASWLAFSIAVELVLLTFLLFGLDIIHMTIWGVLGAILIAHGVGWAVRFRYIGPLFDWMTHTVTALGKTGDRSAVALEQLRSTRDRVRDGLHTGTSDNVTDAGGPMMGSAPVSKTVAAKERAKRRFDVGDRDGAAPAGDLSEALGGAAEAGTTGAAGRRKPGSESTKESGKKGEDVEEQATTSRLLRAKRKAKRDK